MKEIFVHIYTWFSTRKTLLFSLFFICIILFIFLASKLQFNTDLNSMLPQNAESNKKQSVIFQNKLLDKVILSVAFKDTSNDDADKLTAYVEDFSKTLKKIDKEKIIKQIETKQDDEKLIELFDIVNNNLPFLLAKDDYKSIDSLLITENIQNKLVQNYATLANANGLAMKQLIMNDPLGISILAFKKLYNLKLDDNVELYDGYITNKNHNQITFFIYTNYPASQTSKNENLESYIYKASQQISSQDEYKNITIHAFGAQLVAAGNASQMRADTILTLSITMALLLALFLYYFKSFLSPLQIMIPVLFGGLFGMAMMYVIKGTVSLIALGASSIILGIAVNYSLHFMSHLKHVKNKKDTIRELTEPMTIGSFTTVFAFLSLLFVHTPVLQELGLFAAFNLIGSSFCTLIFLPHFVKENNHKKIKQTIIDKIALINPNKSKWMIISICIVTIILSFFMNEVKFNDDMMKMNYLSKDLATSQNIINERNSESLNNVFCVSEGKNFSDALQYNENARLQLKELKENDVIKKYISINDFILTPEIEKEKINNWNEFWTSEKKKKCINELKTIGNTLRYNNLAFLNIEQILNREYSKTDSNYNQIFKTLFKDQIIETD